MNDLAEKLINYRLSYRPKLTQIQMVRKIGTCSIESYRKWEQGITTPNEENLKRLKEVLQINIPSR